MSVNILVNNLPGILHLDRVKLSSASRYGQDNLKAFYLCHWQGSKYWMRLEQVTVIDAPSYT